MAADFINKLIQRKPTSRLGATGPSEIKSHAWLKDIDFSALNERKIIPSFVPSSKEENVDIKNINENWKDDETLMSQQVLFLKEPNSQLLFRDYYYDQNNSNCTKSTSTAVQSTGEEKADKAIVKIVVLPPVKKIIGKLPTK